MCWPHSPLRTGADSGTTQLPAVQGRGIGARLLALAEDRARALHVPQIRLYPNAAMTENLSYYPQHGYTETHRPQQDGFDRVFFRERVDT